MGCPSRRSDWNLEIQALLAEGLTNWQIADQFLLALSTAKGHNRHFYSKRQAEHRTEAIARVYELGLLSSSAVRYEIRPQAGSLWPVICYRQNCICPACGRLLSLVHSSLSGLARGCTAN
ncbi:MAG: hypothetical protein KDE09_11420 [Anaerolineales bacterium]|nr:hypothetical protein [Anaerolineales bacterium]